MALLCGSREQNGSVGQRVQGPRAAGVQAPMSTRRAGGGLVMKWAVVGWA